MKMKRIILAILILSIIFLTACQIEDSAKETGIEQKQIELVDSKNDQVIIEKSEVGSDLAEKKSDDEFDETILTFLNNFYEDYDVANKGYKLKPDLIDCNEHPTFKHMYLELRDWAEAGGQHTAIWAPGSNEGKLGLIGIRERIGLVHGSFDLQSKVEEGTTIRVVIPLLSS